MANMGTYHGTEIPVGSTQDEIRAIIRRVDSQRAGGSSTPEPTPLPSLNDVETTEQTLPSLSSGKSEASDFTNLNMALDDAVRAARTVRQDQELDFLQGVIPEGAVSASRFTGLLKNLNRAADDRSEKTLDIVRDQQDFIQEQQSDIRDLGLALLKEGASSEAIQGVLKAPDMESAISMAAGVMQTVTDDDITVTKLGSDLVMYNAEDPANTVKVIASGSTSTSGSNSGVFKSGGLVIDNNEIGELTQRMDQNRGVDGKTNPQIYISAYNDWIANKGLPQDFFKKFPPDDWLSPTDTTIPQHIKDQMTKPKDNTQINPFTGKPIGQ